MAASNLISCAGCGQTVAQRNGRKFVLGLVLNGRSLFLEHQCSPDRLTEEDVKEIPELVERMFRA